MNKPSILKYALLNSTLTAFYVIVIALFFGNAKAIFGDGPDSLLIPMGMLLLFIFSALVCSGLVLGRPFMWYLDGRKKEALKLLGYTTLVIFIIMIIIFIALYIVSTL